ncbi:MAG: hypothetical protein K2O35_05485 [Clostridia bacterium]|nr:hypothetical protein [Clostridia bacterium]
MAKETKSIELNSNVEELYIGEWEAFGWEVLSSQKISNSRVKLTFCRDRELKNYDELDSRFQRYLMLEDKMKEYAIKKHNLETEAKPIKVKFNILYAIISILFCGIGFIFYLIYFFVANHGYKKDIAKYNEVHAKYEEKYDQLFKESQSIVNEARTFI